MGMNMATIATEAASRLIEEKTGANLIPVSGNMCTDKKPAAIDAIEGRGKVVLADVTIPHAMLRRSCTPPLPRPQRPVSARTWSAPQ